MVVIEREQQGKRGLGVRVLLEIVGVMVAILIAGTMLMSSGGYVPLWWFRFLERLQRLVSTSESRAGTRG